MNPSDMTALPDLLHGRGRSGPVRQQRPVYEVRGLLAVPDGTDQAAYERAGYVTALDAANKGHGPW